MLDRFARWLWIATAVVLATPATPSLSDEGEPRGWIGIVFRAGEEGALVRRVLPGTPAERAGLRVGDRMVTCDGVSLVGLDVSGVQQRLAGAPGVRATIGVVRGAGELQLTVDRIPRPPDDEVVALRDEAELLARPPDQRAVLRVKRLPDDAGLDEVLGVWERYMDERGDAAIREPATFAVVDRLLAVADEPGDPPPTTHPERIEALERQILPVADEALGAQPRYQRRVANLYLDVTPPRPADAVERARAGLAAAGPDHLEQPWLQHALGRALLAQDDIDGALQASAAALERWTAPTLVRLAPDGVVLREVVVDGHSALARLRADALAAAGRDAEAVEVLRARLALRFDEGTAEALVDLGEPAPPAPRPAFELSAEPFPSFEMPRLDIDDRVALADLDGAPALVALWASWCGPCQAELAHLAEVHADLSAAGVGVLAIDVMESRGDGERALRDAGWPFPVAFDEGKALTRALGIRSIPRTYLLDAQGRVVAQYQGFSERAAADQAEVLAELLRGDARATHLADVEVGGDRLSMVAWYPVRGARALLRPIGPPAELLVATAPGELVPITSDGARPPRVPSVPPGWKHVALLADGSVAAGYKRTLVIQPGDGGEAITQREPVSLAALASTGGSLVVAPGGRHPLRVTDAAGAELWRGGDIAVSWALAAGPDADGAPQIARLRPDGLELLSPAGEARGLATLPRKASRIAALPDGWLVANELRSACAGDLFGDDSEVTVVALSNRRVLGLTAAGDVLFRLALPVESSVACADLDGDGRDELWIASEATGVACLRVGADGEGGP